MKIYKNVLCCLVSFFILAYPIRPSSETYKQDKYFDNSDKRIKNMVTYEKEN